MAVITRDQYLASLRALRPNLWKFGQLIDDVTSHPATRRTVESHARAFDASADPEHREAFTTSSSLSGAPIHRWHSLLLSPANVLDALHMKRALFHLTGTCTGGLCVGWTALNALWAVTSELGEGTPYKNRLLGWLQEAESSGWVVAGALTDAKGDRSKRALDQDDPDQHLRVVATTPGGVLVRGAKVMIAGVAACHQILVLPGTAYREREEAFAVAFAVPRDTPGLTVVETRRPSDGRELEEGGFDVPDTGITQAYLLFDDVFVPSHRVFLGGEYQYTGRLIQYFTALYRACIGGCVAGQGDVMIGAARLMARANGLDARSFAGQLEAMAANNETTFGLGAGAIALGRSHASGIWLPDDLTAHTNKLLVATLPQETRRLCQEICGGMVETGCFPSSRDFSDAQLGPLIQKYLAGAGEAEVRARIARLAEWLTIGAGVPGCMHGGGSPASARLVLRSQVPWDRYEAYAANLAGVQNMGRTTQVSRGV